MSKLKIRSAKTRRISLYARLKEKWSVILFPLEKSKLLTCDQDNFWAQYGTVGGYRVDHSKTGCRRGIVPDGKYVDL